VDDRPIIGVWLYLVPMRDEQGVPPARRLAQAMKSLKRAWSFRVPRLKVVYAKDEPAEAKADG
jgi:hypothetical protein